METVLFVQKMTSSTDGNNNLITNPSWEDIEKEIRCLDGLHNTEFILSVKSEQPYMLISGGNEGQYICIVTYDNEVFYNLKDLNNSDDDEVWLVCGGQGADFPAQQVVRLDKVLKAAKDFAEHGKLEPSLEWSSD